MLWRVESKGNMDHTTSDDSVCLFTLMTLKEGPVGLEMR